MATVDKLLEGFSLYRAPIGLATAQQRQKYTSFEQIGFYLIAGLALPSVIWSLIRNINLFGAIAGGTLVQVTCASLAAWFVLSRLRRYARAQLLSYVLPVNVTIFGVILLANAVLRTPISWSLFLTCSFSTLLISYIVTARLRHANPTLEHFLVPGGDLGGLPQKKGFINLNDVNHLEKLIDDLQISGSIIADLRYEHHADWQKLLARAALKGVPIYHFSSIEEALTGEVQINYLIENQFGSLIPNSAYHDSKRIIDLFLTFCLFPIFAILMLVIAAAIFIDGRGTILYKQKRLGYRGEFFQLVKFRTMNASEENNDAGIGRPGAMAGHEESRITRVGRFLRKTRLDELPQIWNVYKGDMSWIGPRPEAAELAQWYEQEIPFYSYRHIVRPGLTGWAQVNQGHVTNVDEVKTKLRLDFYYVKNISLWLDILIVLKTIRVIVQGIGAR